MHQQLQCSNTKLERLADKELVFVYLDDAKPNYLNWMP